MPLPWSLYGGTQVWMEKRAHGLGCPWEGLPDRIGPGSLSISLPQSSLFQHAEGSSPEPSFLSWPLASLFWEPFSPRVFVQFSEMRHVFPVCPEMPWSPKPCAG